MKTALIIDTSSECGVIALLQKDQTLFLSLVPQEKFSELALKVQKAIEIAEPDALVLGIGPGSYTGLRVGASLGFGVAAAKNLPIIGVSSLEAVVKSSGRKLGLIDARSRGAAGYTEAEGHFMVSWEELPLLLKKYPQAAAPFRTERFTRAFSELKDVSLMVDPISPQALFEIAAGRETLASPQIPNLFYFDQLSPLKLPKPSANI